ncbi:MAG: hypothetical protein AAFX09_11890 [Pseudomonadota bacterium]
MARKAVHFEIFLKKHKKASWALVEAVDDRQHALSKAESLLGDHQGGSVRVTREAFDEDSRTFHSVPVFESGPERLRAVEEKNAEASLPCMSPADLRKPPARETVRRALSGWLERHEVCPLELMHRPDLIEELDGSGTDVQHAVQKVAVARASGSSAPVHGYVKLLNALVEKTVAQARKEAKARSKSKTPKGAGFAQLSAQIVHDGGPEKRLRDLIADRLANAAGIGRKAEILIDFHDDLPDEAEAAAVSAAQLDAFLAETLTFERAMRHIFGDARDLGDHVERLTAVFEGHSDGEALERMPDPARRLTAKFKSGDLPEARSAIARRILSDLRKPTRFRPGSVVKEIQLSRQLAQRLIAASGPDLPPEALVEAFTVRSARLLAPDTVDEALAGAQTPVEEIERLLAMEDNIVGEGNKKKLAAYVRAKLKSNTAEAWFRRGPDQPLERLSRLAALQKRADHGAFPETDKAEMAEAFDALGVAVLDETKLFDRISAAGRPALDRAEGLLKIAAQGLIPKGRCTADAQARALRILSSDAGRQEAGAPAARDQLGAIQALMAGMEPHSGEADESAA